MRDTDPVVGRRLGDFEVEVLIGRGGMGSVYRARQPSLGRNVALKVLSPELAASPEFRTRFLAESRTAASLDHPNILPVYDAGEEGGLLYMAVRLVEGGEIDLQALLEREGALRPERALAICAQVASALDAAHAAGLVHRDVKPGNVLLADEHVYLTDFGIAKQSSGRRELTRTGAFVGTLDYASPEQIRNDPVDGAADIYSLGAVLFHCLSGKVPFDRPSDYGVMKAHLEEPPPRLSALRPDLPGTLDAVFATAMAKEKDERYRSGRHLAEAAKAALAGETVPGPIPTVRPTVIDRPVVAPTVARTAAGDTEQPRLRSWSPARVTAIAAMATASVVSVMLLSGWPPLDLPGSASATPAVSATSEVEVGTGTNVSALLADPLGGKPAKITFGAVASPGKLMLRTASTLPALPAGFLSIASYDVKTTAAFSGTALLCFSNTNVTSASKLYHYEDALWVDRTTTPVAPPEICGAFISFSPVAIVRGKTLAELEPPSNPPSAARSSPPVSTSPSLPPAPPSTQRIAVETPPPTPVISSVGCSTSGQTLRVVDCSPALSATTSSTTYAWSAPGGSPSSGNSLRFSTSFDPARPGTFTVTLTACNGSSCASASQAIRVDPNAPAVGPLGCTASVETGQTVSCSPSISGTTSSTTYSWSAPGGSTSSGGGSSFSTSFGSPGTFTITLQACNGGACASGQQAISVTYPPPSPNSLGCTTSVQTGQTVSCSPSISGTTSSTTYSWSASGGSPSSGRDSAFYTSFSSPGTFTITLQACNVSACASRQQAISVTYPPPSPNSLGCTTSVQTGQTVNCYPSISGTTSSTTYSWSASGGSTASGGGSSFSTSFGSPGTFTITLQACNGNACATAQQSVNVTLPAPSPGSLGCSTSVQPGQTVSCYPSISGTTSSTTYSWSASGGSPSSGSGSSFSTSFGSPGTFTITLQACNGSSCASAQQAISVTPPTPFIGDIGCTNSRVQTNQTISCYPQIGGATSGASYVWSASGGSPSIGTGSTFSTSFSSPGTFFITLGVCNGPGFCSEQRVLTVFVAAPATVAPTPFVPTPTPFVPTARPCNIPSKTDINPSTGKAYAVNPSSGVWDDNYWANTVEPALKRQYCPWLF